MARVNYDEQSGRYDAGRGLPAEALTVWMASAKRHVRPPIEEILDLGSGTGQFSSALADTFDADVLAVEPSAGMRERALTKPHPRVTVVEGNADAIPAEDSSFDLAWLSAVIHHFDDLQSGAAEVARVMRPAGSILIREAFGGKPVDSLYRFFPGAKKTIDTFPTVEETIAAFEGAGFTHFFHERIEQLIAHDLGEMVPKIAQRADTTLEHLPDDEFNEGLEHLKHAAQHEHGPVYDGLYLLVIR